jgi:hypothetical protein
MLRFPVLGTIVWKSDNPLTCAQCEEPIRTLDDLGVCIGCGEAFCSRHVVIRGSVANCAACEETRRHREANGPISQSDADRVARLLQQDLLETIDRGHESAVEEAVSRIRMFADDTADFEQRVVDDVQQWLHDSFVDTSWPACPEHPHHPLWYSDGWWKCEQSGRRAAPLGGLRRAAG